MRKNKWWVAGVKGVVLAVVWAALGISASADTAFRPRIEARAERMQQRNVGVVAINGTTAITLRTTLQGQGPIARAALAAQRLMQQIARGAQSGNVISRPVSPYDCVVTVNGTIICHATQQEAAAQHTTPPKLAASWTATIRRLMDIPALSVSTRALVVPLGETRVVSIGGAAPSEDIGVTSGDPRIAQATFSPGQRQVTVRGMTLGSSVIAVQAGNSSTGLTVTVRAYAAQITPTVTVGITGTPSAPATLVAQALYVGLSRAINPADGAQLQLLKTPSSIQSLAVGAHLLVHMPVEMSGPNLLPVSDSPGITVVNQDIPARAAAALLYSNNPESVKQAQTLFVGRLHPFQPARLDYHHQNVSGNALVFHTDLINDTDATAAVHVISGIGLPGTDPVQVGRRAGAAFMNALTRNQGIIVDIPPHARVALVTQRFVNGLTVSGLVQMQQIGGLDNALRVQVVTDTDAQMLSSPLARVVLAAVGSQVIGAPSDSDPSDPDDDPLSPFIFGAPQVNVSANYAVGGPWIHMALGGRDSLRNPEGRTVLYGNYGVSYNLTLNLTNPTADAKSITILFAPEAGPAAGVFQVDNGPIQEFDPHQPPDEMEIARLNLAAGETHVTHILTLPLNGSAYPASIVVHAR